MIGQIVIFEGEEGTEGGGRVEKMREEEEGRDEKREEQEGNREEEEEGRDERGQRGAGRESRIRDRLQMIMAESIVRWQRDKGAPPYPEGAPRQSVWPGACLGPVDSLTGLLNYKELPKNG